MTDEAVATETLALLEEWAAREPERISVLSEYTHNAVYLGDKWGTWVTPDDLDDRDYAIISAAVQERFEEANAPYTHSLLPGRTNKHVVWVENLPVVDAPVLHLAWLRALVAWLKIEAVKRPRDPSPRPQAQSSTMNRS